MSTETTDETIDYVPETMDADDDTQFVDKPTIPVRATPAMLVKPKPNLVDLVKQKQKPKTTPRQKPKMTPDKQEDPEKYLLTAKALVVQNYNEHRNPKHTSVLVMDAVFITWFSKALLNWKAVLGSTSVRGLLWEVSFNGEKHEAYVDTYRKINHIRIPLGNPEK